VKRKPTKNASLPVSAKPSVPTGLIIEIAAVLILAGIPFTLGKFFEFNQPDPFDGGAYAYSAWHVYQGAKFGSEEIISAQPATFLMNYIGVSMFGYSELGPEIIQTILQLAGLALMFYTLRRCFGKAAAVICTSAASIYLSAPVIAKFGNVKEQFMIAFMVWTACFMLLTIKTKKEWLWAAVGACSVWPYYFKPTGLSVLAATGICVVLFSLPLKRWTLFLNRLFLLAGGALAGISPMLIFFYWKTGRPLFLTTFPFLLIKAIIALAILGYTILALSRVNKQFHLIGRIKRVPLVYWTTGATAIIAMHIIGSILVRIQPGAIGDDIGNYLYATPFFETACYVYYRLCGVIGQLWTSLGTNDIYVTGSRALMGFAQQSPIVLRYYALLKLPISLAVVSILILSIRLSLRALKKISDWEPQDRMAIFLALWWLFDMGMIWVSPRSYEQYYLPMCASAAMLGGYGIWQYMERLNPVQSLIGKLLAPAALLVITGMIWPIFAGITHSPFSGTPYKNSMGVDSRSRGYAQSWHTMRNEGSAPWEQISDYIRTHSSPEDRMYVWGWYPGIYVRAQRLSASPQAFEGNMHILPFHRLITIVRKILNGFAQHPPKFIVDSRKREFPWNVPPLELWPQVPKELQGAQRGFLSTDPVRVKRFEMSYSALLAKQASPEEARRFEAMKPFRDYVMENYNVAGSFGPHVLFVRKTQAAEQE
jgi:4-amino-4-deoxy-L-arabinose transferase-like glycosyltransferase